MTGGVCKIESRAENCFNGRANANVPAERRDALDAALETPFQGYGGGSVAMCGSLADRSHVGASDSTTECSVSRNLHEALEYDK